MSNLKNGSTAEKRCNRMGWIGMLVTLGIVFGDIGTSPLYVMKAILHVGQRVDEPMILGALSCIIWTLTLQTTVKYVLVALRADNHGEGGILALYALLRRHKRKWIYLLALMGAGTLLADGIITPAITVTTAIEGLESVSPHLPVLPITLAIITVVFFVQRFGTESIGKSFGGFMLLWFLLLGVVGTISLVSYPQVIRALNPFVKTMLILNYLGQGAWILCHADVAASVNPFYAIMPQGLLIFSIVMATGAAIVASQALISGTFSILSEAMNLDFWPRMRIKHPTHVKGQLFIPAVNMAMYIGVVLILLLFRDSSHMEAAYGLAISITMLMTTSRPTIAYPSMPPTWSMSIIRERRVPWTTN